MIKNFFNFISWQKASFALSTFGLGFQIFILNPWQKKISSQLSDIEKKIKYKDLVYVKKNNNKNKKIIK